MTAIICTVATGPAAFADIGITTAARMIDGSDVIFVGRLSVENGAPVAIREQVLKGNPPAGAIALIDPSEGGFLAFNLGSLVGAAQGSSTLLLGELDRETGGLRLKWLFASLWPQGYQPTTFPSDTLAKNTAFVERVLGYSKLARDPDALAVMLHADITGRSDHPPHAALAYLEVALERDLGEPLPMLMRALGAAAVAGNRSLDPAAIEQLVTLAPVLPASITAPLLLDLSTRAQETTATLLRNALWPMLSARGAQVGPQSGAAALERALASLLPALRRADANRALAAYDTGLAHFQSDFGDLILTAILGQSPGQPLAGLSPSESREVWKKEIAALR